MSLRPAVLALGLVLSACSTSSAVATHESFGTPGAGTLIVVAQGGPLTSLTTAQAEPLFADLDLDQTEVAFVHQAQTIDSDRFFDGELTLEQAAAANAESVELLVTVVDDAVGDDRRVLVVGISFGALLVQELIADGRAPADGYLLLGGRLDMPVEAVTTFAEGDAPGFVDGTEIIARGTGQTTRERNMARLVAALGRHRYTKRLAGLDLSDVVYFTADRDERAGRLSETETEFLTEHGATPVVVSGRHQDVTEGELGTGLLALLETDGT